MPRALVTGANGLVGAQLCLALADAGWETVALVRRPERGEQLAARGISLAVGDVTEAESLETPIRNCDVAFHVAGVTAALRDDDFFRVNVEGTRNVAAACVAAANPPVLVHISSLAAAGPTTPDRPRREEVDGTPVSQYGRSKRAAEDVLYSLADAAPISIVRPPIVYGPGDRNGLEMYRSVKRFGLFAVPGFRLHRYSNIDSRDLAGALIAVAERGERLRDDDEGDRRGVYYAAAEPTMTFADLCDEIARVLGRRRSYTLRLPPRFTWGVATIVEQFARLRGRPFILNRDKLREATAGSWICSPERLARETGFRVTTPTVERLRTTVDWYRAAGWL